MQVESKKLKPSLVEVRVRESAAEMEKFRKKGIDHIREHAKIPGFRAGVSIPEDVIISHYGEAAIKEATLEQALDALYRKALKKAGILPVDQGSIKKVESISPLDVTIEVEIYPEIVLDEKKIAKIKLPLKKASVSSEEVQHQIDALRDRLATFAETTDALAQGNRATIDAQGFDTKTKAAIPETKVSAYPLVLGSGSFIPGFEEKLEGKKAGEEVTFDITFPKDYHSESFKNRSVQFTVKILKAEAKNLPEVNDAFAQKIRGPLATADSLGETIKHEMLESREGEVRAQFEEALLDELLKVVEVEPGEKLLAHEVERVFNDHKGRLENEGIDFKHYLEHLKMDETQFKKEKIEAVALRRIQAELVLHALKEKHNPSISDEEVKTEVDHILARYTDSAFRSKIEDEIYKPGTAYWEEVKTKIAYKKIIDTFAQ